MGAGYSMMNIGDTLLKKLCCCASAGYCIKDTLPKKMWSCVNAGYYMINIGDTLLKKLWRYVGGGKGRGVPGMM